MNIERQTALGGWGHTAQRTLSDRIKFQNELKGLPMFIITSISGNAVIQISELQLYCSSATNNQMVYELMLYVLSFRCCCCCCCRCGCHFPQTNNIITHSQISVHFITICCGEYLWVNIIFPKILDTLLVICTLVTET